MKARDEADFSQFAPVLQEWVDLLKKYAGAIDSSRPIYDVLLDDFEKGMTSSRLDEIFTEVTQCMLTLNPKPINPEYSSSGMSVVDQVGQQRPVNSHISNMMLLCMWFMTC